MSNALLAQSAGTGGSGLSTVHYKTASLSRTNSHRNTISGSFQVADTSGWTSSNTWSALTPTDEVTLSRIGALIVMAKVNSYSISVAFDSRYVTSLTLRCYMPNWYAIGNYVGGNNGYHYFANETISGYSVNRSVPVNDTLHQVYGGASYNGSYTVHPYVVISCAASGNSSATWDLVTGTAGCSMSIYYITAPTI